MRKEVHKDRYKNKGKKTFWMTVGGLIGVVTILGAIIAFAQLIQSMREAREQDHVQATSFAFQVISQATNTSILQQQLELQSKIATIQSNDLIGQPTSIVSGQQINELKSTQTAISYEKSRLDATSTVIAGSFIQKPSITSPNPTTTVTSTHIPIPETGSTMISPKDGMMMMYVPAGEFLMGASDSDTPANNDEKPQHKVYLDAFWIDRTEVTNDQYLKCVRANICPEPYSLSSATRTSYFRNPDYTDYPVTSVNWVKSVAYCDWVGRRLPTEAEWEKAARGTDGRIYPWGDEKPDCILTNFSTDDKVGCIGDTNAVGEYPAGASPYGVMDMAGNVAEWVNDWYQSDYYIGSLINNPQGPNSAFHKVNRGGSFLSGIDSLRVTARYHNQASTNGGNGGFRCAFSPYR